VFARDFPGANVLPLELVTHAATGNDRHRQFRSAETSVFHRGQDRGVRRTRQGAGKALKYTILLFLLPIPETEDEKEDQDERSHLVVRTGSACRFVDDEKRIVGMPFFAAKASLTRLTRVSSLWRKPN